MASNRVLVVGVAGTGKSYLVKEMKRSKLNAFDADDGFATFIDAAGNEVEYDPHEGEEWWESHFYVLKPGKLQKLLRENKTVYLFGDVGGQPRHTNGLVDVAHLFDEVFYLQAPIGLMEERLSTRTDNPFGKDPGEIKGIARHKEKLDRIARAKKFKLIDATLPTERIIEILTMRR